MPNRGRSDFAKDLPPAVAQPIERQEFADRAAEPLTLQRVIRGKPTIEVLRFRDLEAEFKQVINATARPARREGDA